MISVRMNLNCDDNRRSWRVTPSKRLGGKLLVEESLSVRYPVWIFDFTALNQQ